MPSPSVYNGSVSNGSARVGSVDVTASKNSFGNDSRTSGSFKASKAETLSSLGHLPTVTAEVVESAVLLAKAEVKLALIEARGLAQKAVGALTLVVVACFLLHASVLLLVLGPLLSVELSVYSKWGLIFAPFALTVLVAWFAVRSLREVQKYDR